MKRIQFETMGGRVAKIAAPALVFFLSLAAPAVSQTNLVNAIPGAAVSSVSTPAPKGVTTVDVTKKKNPQVVNHEPGKVEPKRYEENGVAEGGTIEVSPQWHVNAGVDSLGGRGMLSVLESTNAADSPVLQAFGRDSSNLADRDRNLIFFASPTQLVIVEDHRWYGMDYYIN